MPQPVSLAAQQALVELAPVRELAAVELLQQAAFDLCLGEVRARHHDGVAGLAGHELGVGCLGRRSAQMLKQTAVFDAATTPRAARQPDNMKAPRDKPAT
ncbi:MAG: hypothetical protein ABI671_12615 [Burkholderiales bacterium]